MSMGRSTRVSCGPLSCTGELLEQLEQLKAPVITRMLSQVGRAVTCTPRSARAP